MNGYRLIGQQLGGWTLWLLLAILPQQAAAQENLLFKGNLVEAPPCTISDDKRIDVQFKGNIAISKIDGSNYREPVPFQIQCEERASGVVWKMQLTIVAKVEFDENAIETSIPGLGIKIMLGDRIFPLNVAQKIDIDSIGQPLELAAVPVKKSGAELIDDAFSASALLIAEVY
nr:fimbrial protein [Pseudomonas sp. FFPRI_1]